MEQAQYLARLAVEETKIGVLEDKAIKNMVATEFVYNYVKDKRTVGVIREYPERGLVEVAEPIGVIFSLTADHQSDLDRALQVHHGDQDAQRGDLQPASQRVAVLLRSGADHVRDGGEARRARRRLHLPGIAHPATTTRYLMHHKDIGLIDATGGPGAVKAAYSSGKPALGVGAGNTPVYLEKSADLDMAVVDIITSKTFDNGTICASEQTVVIDDEIYDEVLRKFAELGSHICNEKETEMLSQHGDRSQDRLHAADGGRTEGDATSPASSASRSKPKTKLLIAPIKGVGRDYPLSVEKLFPVLAVYRANSVDEALKVCVDVNHAGGLGHTAVVFSQQRRGHPEVRRRDQRRANHRELAGIDRRAGRRLQRHGADLLVRLRHRRRQQHHRQRQRLSLPQHQARGAKDTGAYVVPCSQPDLLQHERGGEPAATSRRGRRSSSPTLRWSSSGTWTS